MKIFQNLVKLIVFSIFVLPVLLYAVSETLTENVPSKTVKLHDSFVKGSDTKSVPGEVRVLEAIVADLVTNSYGGGTGTLWVRGGLRISGIQIVDQVGSFQGFIGGVAQKKSEGSETKKPTTWNFNLTGTYNINKCPNKFSKNTANVAWDPAGKNLVGWNKSDNIQYLFFSCRVNSTITWQDVKNASPYDRYGFFYCDNPNIILPESVNKETECPKCHTSSFLYEEYLLDWEFFDTKMEINQWKEANSAGPLTQARWNACLTETIAHEKRHREHFKSCVLDVVKPMKFIINVCNHNDPQAFSNRAETIDIENKKMEEDARKILVNAIAADDEAAAGVDTNDNGPFMEGNTSVED